MTLSRLHELKLIEYAIEHLISQMPKTDGSVTIGIRSATKVRRVKPAKRTMTAKQRKDVSRRMKAYWAKKRKS